MANTKPRKPVEASGAPRWTYGLGAIVGALTFGWAVASYFIPKPDPPKHDKGTAATAPPAPQSASVSVSGSGNVGVGVMSGGTVSVGAPTVGSAAAPSAPASRP